MFSFEVLTVHRLQKLNQLFVALKHLLHIPEHHVLSFGRSQLVCKFSVEICVLKQLASEAQPRLLGEDLKLQVVF